MIFDATPYDTPTTTVLKDDEVHIWRASLDHRALHVLNFQRYLSEDEHARARRFRFREDRDCFVVARGILRTVLATYLSMEPGQVRFCYGAHGKPALDGEPDEGVIRFSVSHSHGLALFAITRGPEVGIDLERIWFHPANEDVAELYFSPRELSILRALPSDARQDAFFALWTRKEAYVKAAGKGFLIPLKQLDVSLAIGDSAILMSTDGDGQESSRWLLRDLNPGPGFAAALAVERHDCKLKWRQWSELTLG